MNKTNLFELLQQYLKMDDSILKEKIKNNLVTLIQMQNKQIAK